MSVTSGSLPNLVASLSTSGEAREIYDFYEQHRPENVYLRHLWEIEEAIKNELFFAVRNQRGQIVAASGVYLLTKGDEVVPFKMEGGRPISGTAAELGSVLRWSGGLDASQQVSQVWHPFLFGVPMLLFARRVLGESRSTITNHLPRLDVAHLFCTVQHAQKHDDLLKTQQERSGVTHNLMRLRGEEQPSPHRWRMFVHTQELENKIKTTSDDTTLDRDKYFLEAPVGNLFNVARYMQRVIYWKALKNGGDQILPIDVRNLVDHLTTYFRPDGDRFTLLDWITSNQAGLKQHAAVGWGEFGRIGAAVLPKVPKKPLHVNGGNPWYHDPDAIIARGNTNGSGYAAAAAALTNNEHSEIAGMSGGNRSVTSPTANHSADRRAFRSIRAEPPRRENQALLGVSRARGFIL